MRATLQRLLSHDDGQDLVEYALLVAFVGLVAVAAFLALEDALGNAYSGLDIEEQDLAAQTPDPW